MKKRESLWDFSDPTPLAKAPAKRKRTAPVDKAPWDEDGEDESGLTGAVKIKPVPVEISLVDLSETEEKILKPKLDKEAFPATADPELHITFEDLDIEAPYVEAFKAEFKIYPILVVKSFCKLPLRYSIVAGKKQFKMASFEAGQEFRVSGTEAGKKVPLNIICKYRGDELVLEPSMINRFCKIVNPHHSSFKKKLHGFSTTDDGGTKRRTPTEKATTSSPSPPPPPSPSISKGLKDAINQRKKEAMFKL